MNYRSLVQAVAIGLLVGVFVAGVPASQFTTGTLARDTDLAVTNDTSAVVGLDGATTLGDEGGSSRKDLFVLTNRFDSPIDVTVTLTSNTGSFDVCTPTRCAGDSTTVTDIAPADTQRFEVEKTGGGPGKEVSYRVTVQSDAGVRTVLERTASRGQGGGPGGGQGNGQGGGPPA